MGRRYRNTPPPQTPDHQAIEQETLRVLDGTQIRNEHLLGLTCARDDREELLRVYTPHYVHYIPIQPPADQILSPTKPRRRVRTLLSQRCHGTRRSVESNRTPGPMNDKPPFSLTASSNRNKYTRWLLRLRNGRTSNPLLTS